MSEAPSLDSPRSSFARRLLSLALGAAAVEAVLGDIEEGRAAGRSRLWYWRQVLGGTTRGLFRRLIEMPRWLARDLVQGRAERRDGRRSRCWSWSSSGSGSVPRRSWSASSTGCCCDRSPIRSRSG